MQVFTWISIFFTQVFIVCIPFVFIESTFTLFVYVVLVSLKSFYQQLDSFKSFLTYLICISSTILGANNTNRAYVPLSNKQTNNRSVCGCIVRYWRRGISKQLNINCLLTWPSPVIPGVCSNYGYKTDIPNPRGEDLDTGQCISSKLHGLLQQPFIGRQLEHPPRIALHGYLSVVESISRWRHGDTLAVCIEVSALCTIVRHRRSVVYGRLYTS